MKKYEKLLSTEPLMRVLPDLKTSKTRELVVKSIFSYIEKNYGKKTAEQLKILGLKKIHKVVPIKDIPALRKYIDKELNVELLQWAIYICKKEMEFDEKFFIDKSVYLRINYPHIDALKGPRTNVDYNKVNFSNVIGKTLRKDFSGALKGLYTIIFTKNKKAYNLARYNKNNPQATWAHGPHIDTWYGHSYDAINFWWSITGVNEENSMVVFPESHKLNFPFNPKHMYLEDNIKTPKPEKIEMVDGELILFDPELLHSTRINTSDDTRIVLTIRACPVEPSFSESTEHDLYDTWYRTEDVEKGVLKEIKVGKRVPKRAAKDWDGGELRNIDMDADFSRPANLGAIAQYPLNTLTQVSFKSRKLLVANIDGQFHVTQANCSHVGAPLAAGSIVGGKIQCPAHGILFCAKTGETKCSKIAIKSYEVSVHENSDLILN